MSQNKYKDVLYKSLTIPIFLIPFLFAVTDSSVNLFFNNFLSQLKDWAFMIMYFIYMYFIYKIAKGVIKIAPFILVDLRNNSINNLRNGLKLFFISYFLGGIIGLGNEFILVLFNKFLFNGVNNVF